jgi:hypothetical protein
MSCCVVCCTCDATADMVKRARKSGTNRVEVDEHEASCVIMEQLLHLGASVVVCGVRVCISPCRTAQLYDTVRAQRRAGAAHAAFAESAELDGARPLFGSPAGASAARVASAPSPLSQAEMK